jgi:DNA-binding transcriptional ArsR family regulator
MNIVKEDLLLHPVRLRIILATARRQVTAQQLANELPDIPQATLYRNINTLAAAGILSVVQERRVRNTVEKTYELPAEGLFLTLDDLKNAQPEDYMRLFTQFLGQLLGYYARYIQKGDVDFGRDSVAFQMSPFYLSEAELNEVRQALNAAFQPYIKNEPAPERKRIILGLISLPDTASDPLPGGTQPSSPAAKFSNSSKE